MDTGMIAQQSQALPVHVANRILPRWLLPNLLADKLDLVLDQMLFVHCQLEDRMANKMTSRLYTLRTGLCTYDGLASQCL